MDKKKYIIELESGTHIFVLGPEGIVHIGEPDVVYETVDGMQIGDAVINAKPYTEPDIEQVRKEAYEEGREAGIKDGKCEAWEAARRIIHMPEGDLLNVFTECYSAVCTALQVILKYDAAEAIEKIRQYEQEKEEIKVGDEVTAEHGGSTFTVTWMSDVCICGIDSDGRYYSYMVDEVDGKTGNHHEIAAVLEKMRGETNE